MPALAVKPKVKKEKKDAVAMMKALKEQQNAKKKAEADAAAAEAAAEAERNVDVQDAGPYGDTALGNKGAAVTALVRKQAATAEQPGMNGWKDNLKMVYEEGVITGPNPDAADDVRAELPRAKPLPSQSSLLTSLHFVRWQGVQIDLSRYAYKDASELGTFSYAQLAGSRAALPEGMNPRRRETYLSDADFCQVFGVASREEFYRMPVRAHRPPRQGQRSSGLTVCVVCFRVPEIAAGQVEAAQAARLRSAADGLKSGLSAGENLLSAVLTLCPIAKEALPRSARAPKS